MIPVDTYSGQPVAVMGLGRSGIAAALALGAGDAHVWGWDDGEDARDAARQSGVPLVDLYQGNLSEAAALILSPGIPHLHPEPHPLALKARDAGCEIICDIELLARTNRDAAYLHHRHQWEIHHHGACRPYHDGRRAPGRNGWKSGRSGP